LLITDSKRVLNRLKSTEVVQELKEKFILSLSTLPEFWTDPTIFNNGLLVPIQDPENIPIRKKIGGHLRGRHLKVAGCEFRPWIYVVKDANGKETFEGDHLRIVVTGAAVFNYTYQVTLDSTYAQWHEENQTWTGGLSRVW
jgi:hypothetical protein